MCEFDFIILVWTVFRNWTVWITVSDGQSAALCFQLLVCGITGVTAWGSILVYKIVICIEHRGIPYQQKKQSIQNFSVMNIRRQNKKWGNKKKLSSHSVLQTSRKMKQLLDRMTGKYQLPLIVSHSGTVRLQNVLHITLLVPGIWRWLLRFWKIPRPLLCMMWHFPVLGSVFQLSMLYLFALHQVSL
jgi:hypothetical protein